MFLLLFFGLKKTGLLTETFSWEGIAVTTESYIVLDSCLRNDWQNEYCGTDEDVFTCNKYSLYGSLMNLESTQSYDHRNCNNIHNIRFSLPADKGVMIESRVYIKAYEYGYVTSQDVHIARVTVNGQVIRELVEDRDTTWRDIGQNFEKHYFYDSEINIELFNQGLDGDSDIYLAVTKIEKPQECNTDADTDCDGIIEWNEIKNYVVAWATGDAVTYGGPVLWNDVKISVIAWATGS